MLFAIHLLWFADMTSSTAAQTAVHHFFTDHSEQRQGTPSSTETRQRVLNPTHSTVPPEILHAIYPNRQTGSQENAPNQFDSASQFTPLSMGSKENESRPFSSARFNESLMPSMNRSQPEAFSAEPSASPWSLNQVGDPSGLQRQDGGAGYFDLGDQGVQWDATQATHLVPADHRNLPVPAPTSVRQTWEAPALSGVKSPLTQTALPEAQQIEEKSGYRPATLAELLDESNRQNEEASTRQSQFNAKLDQDYSINADVSETTVEGGTDSFPNGNLTATIQRISVALCLVLAVTCALLLLAKYLFFGKSKARDKNSEPKSTAAVLPSSIKLLTQLRLDNKSQLYLVQANDQQVLVAVDLTGIKSVVPLQADFRASLEEELARSQPRATTRSIVQAIEDEMEDMSEPQIYSAASFQANFANAAKSNLSPPATDRTAKSKSQSENLETEMKKKLAELLRGTLVNQKV